METQTSKSIQLQQSASAIGAAILGFGIDALCCSSAYETARERKVVNISSDTVWIGSQSPDFFMQKNMAK
ncbi:hypothetical protein [Segetibacter koreensis]|uniref:hypothetical protein n=1 Tax=Segetibacter koreensis TaxID=398037 RepID=UPI0012F72C4A|nr:hypothetical protein [Segetibacter koreensis]